MAVRITVGTVGLVGLSGTAGAHGAFGHAGGAVAFAAVIALPVVAGLGGGAIALRRWGPDGRRATGQRTDVALGLLLAVLGATLVIPSMTTGRSLGVAGGAIGAASAVWVGRRGRHRRRGCRADVALGAVSGHRLLEGAVLGALYAAGSAVALAGAVLVAGHAAVETAAVGGMYATAPRRTRTVGVALVQVSYVAGAVAGLGVVGAVPASVQTVGLAVAGGALLAAGVGQTGRSVTAT